MSDPSDSSPTTANPDFDKRVEEQVQKTIQAMTNSGSLAAPGTPASQVSVTYVTDPYKGDFDPVDNN